MVANPKLVPDNDAVAGEMPYHSPAEESHIDTTAAQEQVTSTVPQTPASSHTFIRKAMGNQNLQEEVMDITCLSWRETTTSPYEGLHRQWKTIAAKGMLIPLLQMC